MRINISRHSMSLSLYYATLILIAIPFALPLMWLISIALRPTADIYISPPKWIPDQVTFDNFRSAWHLLDVPQLLGNTLFITIFSIVGSLFSSSLVGFAFATLPARGKNIIFGIVLMTIMVPNSVTLIPLFILFSKLKLVNSFWPLILPHFFANAFYVFLFRQFFMNISRSIFEQAEMDGCNPLQAYWYLALPMSRPAIAAVMVFVFIGSWNDFLGPLIYLNTANNYTISLGLSLFQGMYWTQLHYIMPMSLVALIPVVFIFIITQRYMVSSISATGLKA